MDLDEGNASNLVLLDQSAAFDTIDHAILLDRLSARFRVTGAALWWFTSNLSGRTQSVCLAGSSSGMAELTSGVPQGSVLGPVLFSLYIGPLHKIALRHGVNVHFYADDIQLRTFFRPSRDAREQREAIRRLRLWFLEIKSWLRSNMLVLNDDKTEAVVVKSNRQAVQSSVMDLRLEMP